MHRLPTIYKMDSKGKIREWTVEVDGNKWRTIAGLMGGNLVTSEWTVATAASQDTDEQQAEFEADAARTHKLKREYYDNLKDAESGVPAMFKPMLATDFAKTKPSKITLPCLVQPKLDGIRCIIKAEGAFTRQNKPILSIPHILEALDPFFKHFPDAILDGELYNHELREDFQAITSIVRREKFKPGDLEKSADLIQYHVYDCAGSEADGTCIDTRLYRFAEWLGEDHTGPLRLVDTGIAERLDQLDYFHGLWTGQGYEGSMIRLAGPYDHKRSKRLIKRKDFDTEEFTIARVEEGQGNWTGYAKRIVYTLPDGREFGSGVRGTQQQMKEVLDNAASYKGTIGTVRFFGLTDEGIPRFPVTLDLHGGPRVD